MDTTLDSFTPYLPPPLRDLPWRAHPMDGKLLLFERNTGLNVLLEGEETAHFQRIAPRSLLVAVTNACNMTCPFCYRDLESRSLWRYENLLQFCQEADAWGVLEVAFGGGEPMVFPRWQEFICALHETTGLGINFTTNGTLLTEDFLRAIAGHYGQIRVSLYEGNEDNHWPETVVLLTRCGARYGVNWLITPADLDGIEAKFMKLLALGVRDFLLLSYKGADPRMHLGAEEMRRFSNFVKAMHARFGAAVQIKLDVCWGDSLGDVPRLFSRDDCGAGDDFLSITSDKHVKVCSFQQTNTGLPFDTIADLRQIWERLRKSRLAATIGGCARLPNRGLSQKGAASAYLDLAAVQQQP
ncbi:MAG TPA: radical SAM protein [Aggregatilineales bacterium]|nr:radical SAM protein [Aggregatilineales bacterium]